MSAHQTLETGQRESAAPGSTDSPVDRIRRAASTDPISVQPLRGKLSLITGAGGNVVLFDDPDGALLIDTAINGSRVEATVASLTPAPIRYLVNTHWHFDHTDGNEWLARNGATIVAHMNTRRHLSEATRVEAYGYTFPPVPTAALPRTIFSNEYRLALGHATVTLRHYDPGHTDGDISGRFEGENVLQVGDTWWNGVYPFIDYSTGGSIDGLIAAAEWNLAATTGDTIIVPGHGPAGDRSQLKAYYDILVAVREEVARLKARGLALEETIAAKPTALFDDPWGGSLVGPDFFVRLVYRGV